MLIPVSAVQQVEPQFQQQMNQQNGTTDPSRTTNDFNYGRWNDGRFINILLSVFIGVIIGIGLVMVT